MAEYRNPSSKNVRKNPTLNRVLPPNKDVFLGEVISVEHTGPKSGAIIFRSYGSENVDPMQGMGTTESGGNKLSNIAIPLLANIKAYPIVGEQVILFKLGNIYYFPLNALNNPISNQVPFVFSTTGVKKASDGSKVASISKNTFRVDPSRKYYITGTSPGDIVIEGRAGNSIKFGSTVKGDGAVPNLYSKSDLSKNGDPILIIRNDPQSTSENIQQDGASIYMCSTQKIPIDDGKNGFEGITGTWSSLNVNAEEITVEEIKLNSAQVQVMTEMRDGATRNEERLRVIGDQDGASAARERAGYLDSQLKSGEAASAAYIEETPPSIDPNISDICKKIVAYAQADAAVPIVETPPGSNYSPRINQMVRLAGLDNESKYNRDGEGYYWCAAAVTAWYKAAGADTPPGATSCDNWMRWAQNRGTFSRTPVVGAAVLYGNLADSNHIGIVEKINGDGSLVTIEGNTSGGSGFNRNGGGVYRKQVRKLKRIAGFVLPTQGGRLAPCAQQNNMA
jgi:surface antigen